MWIGGIFLPKRGSAFNGGANGRSLSGGTILFFRTVTDEGKLKTEEVGLAGTSERTFGGIYGGICFVPQRPKSLSPAELKSSLRITEHDDIC